MYAIVSTDFCTYSSVKQEKDLDAVSSDHSSAEYTFYYKWLSFSSKFQLTEGDRTCMKVYKDVYSYLLR